MLEITTVGLHEWFILLKMELSHVLMCMAQCVNSLCMDLGGYCLPFGSCLKYTSNTEEEIGRTGTADDMEPF